MSRKKHMKAPVDARLSTTGGMVKLTFLVPSGTFSHFSCGDTADLERVVAHLHDILIDTGMALQPDWDDESGQVVEPAEADMDFVNFFQAWKLVRAKLVE